MKILIVSHEYPPVGGGGANACINLAREYVAAGHKVTVLTVWYEGLENSECIDGVNIIRVRSKRKYLDHCSFTEMFDYLLKAFAQINSIVKSERYNVCQVFFAIPSGPIGYYLKKRYDIPYVIRFGGGDIPGAQKRFKYIYKILTPFIKVIWRNAEYLVANSEELKRKALAFYAKRDVQIITNGVDENIFSPDEADKRRDRIELLFVSRLIEGKGLQYVIPKLNEVKAIVNKEIHLTIVGEGPYRNELEKITLDSNADAIVSFCGFKKKEDLIPYYQNADVFILPSLSEGMPNVVLEAMASGLPVVMTPCGGSKELIDDNGFIVDIKDFCTPIIQLCKDEKLRVSMGKKGRERVRKYFSWGEKASEYLNLFNNIAK